MGDAGLRRTHLDPTTGHEQAGKRPVLILSDDRFNLRSGTVICMPLTTREPRAGFPFTLSLPNAAPPSYVKTSQIRTLSTARLGKLVERRTRSEVDACLEALLVICGMQPTRGQP